MLAVPQSGLSFQLVKPTVKVISDAHVFHLKRAGRGMFEMSLL